MKRASISIYYTWKGKNIIYLIKIKNNVPRIAVQTSKLRNDVVGAYRMPENKIHRDHQPEIRLRKLYGRWDSSVQPISID